MDDPQPHDTDTLQGWKEIAAYLRKSVRTAQRWEAELGLPVQRTGPPDGTRTPCASRRAIDAWREQRASLGAPDSEDEAEEVDAPDGVDRFAAPPAAPAAGAAETAETAWRRPARRWAAVAFFTFVVGMAIGATLGLTAGPSLRTPSRFQVDGHEIRALTDSDATVWTYRLDAAGRRPETMAFTTPDYGDIDGDGSPEVAISVTFARPEYVSSVSDAMFLFGRDGRLRWKVQPGLQGDERLGVPGPWRLRDVAFSLTAPRRVWIAYSHDRPEHPSFVLEIDAEGRQTMRYVQAAGPISTLAHWPTASGDYLAVGGTDTATSLASVALVSPTKGLVRWPAADGVPCDGCPREQPEAVYLLPRSELNPFFNHRYGSVFRLVIVDGRMRINTDDGPRSALLAWIDPDLRMREGQRTLRYWTIHDALQAEGRLDHTVANCPDRYRPVTIRTWRASSGWSDSPVLLGAGPTQSPAGPASRSAR